LAAIPVKFLGGVLAIGSGLALGREGPTIQMGATIASQCARRLADPADRLAVHAAGAGLAVAFNAPVGGCVFVFEELTRQVSRRLMVTVLVTTGIAIAAMRALLRLPAGPDRAVDRTCGPRVAARFVSDGRAARPVGGGL
jgi:CIC family chloride channel protein